MDEKAKKKCPNCSQLYELKVSMLNTSRNIPLFLPCGHCTCENCITNIIKFNEPVECHVCGKSTTISANDAAELTKSKSKLYKAFPLNVYMLGELVSQALMEENPVHFTSENFIDLRALIESTDVTHGKCAECKSITNMKCVQCAMIMCDACFNETHKNFVIFKSHVLSNIEPTIEPSFCKTHKGKPLDYFCNDCDKSICMDCFMIGGEKSCKTHSVVSMDEVNESFKDDLNNHLKNIDEKFRRLTKTAVDVGQLLQNIENQTAQSSELNQMMVNVEQNFSKLLFVVQKHKMEITDIIQNLKSSEYQSLLKAKDDIAEYLKKTKTVMNSITRALNPENPIEANFAVLLDEALQVEKIPWYLNKDKQDDELKLTVNEDLCTLVNDYIHLNGNANCTYKLCNTSELPESVTIPPAPTAPVFPPELPKDVRQKTEPKKEVKRAPSVASSKESMTFFKDVPKYRSSRSKTGSVTSLNSDDSQTSYQASNRNSYGFGEMYQSQKPAVQKVQPFPDSQHPKPLHEGCQELIFISHIVNPHNFFVQRACHQSLVKDLVRQFRNADKFPKPSLSHITEGKSYLVFNKADNMWQRCRVVRIDRSNADALKFHVFCIDFGSTEIVDVDKLRPIPPASVQSPYPLAMHCALANCRPKSGSWTTEDSILVQKIIDNKQAIIHVRAIHSTPTFLLSMTAEVDVTTFVDGVSLAHALAFHDRAVLINPKLSYPNIVGSMERPKLFISNNDFKPKSVEEVFITYVVSPDKFFVRKRHSQTMYDKLCDDLEDEYSVALNTGSIYLPEVGMLCVAYVEESEHTNLNGSWQRVLITELCGRGKVRAKLPDTGNMVVLHTSSLRHINYKYSSLAALAKECHLAGVTPPQKKWSHGSVALLRKFQNKLLELHVEDQRRSSIGVVLYDRADEDNIVCVNSEMITYNFAVSFGIYSFNKSLKKPDTNPGPSGDKQKKEKIKVIQRKDQKPNKKPEKASRDDDDLDAKDKGPLRIEVKLLHYESPSLFYVALEHQQKFFSEFFEKLQKYYSKCTASEEVDWAVGNKCCCLCLKSQTWRRAVIQEINGENAKVFYSDFANTETVPLSSLRRLSPDFTKIGDAAIKCHICGVLSASGADWPAITKEYLKELMDAYPRLFITKLGTVKDKSMPVELWVYHTIEGGALEPNRNEWRCLNKKIIEQGLGIPDKSQPMSNLDNEVDTTDDMLSCMLRNVVGDVSNFLQLDQAEAKPKAGPSKENPNTDEEVEVDPSGAVLINDWLPAEPLKNTEFTGMPTYIDIDGVIFLHDLEQRQILDFLSQALDTKFNKHKRKHTKWTMGEICIARFCLDNRFYRGRILQVNNDKTCLVQYVDYGNEEVCSFEDLRKNIALYQVPIQAHRCSLGRIKPIGSQWDRQTLDYIHKTIVEKTCFVKVLGEPVDGITPIDLKIGPLWISEHLVDFDMALFIDGTKKVIRRCVTNNVEHSVEESSESDSDPDYIVEEDAGSQSSKSSHDEYEDANALVGKDWNQVIEEDTKKTKGIYVQFPRFMAEEFKCNILIINNANELELTIIHDEETTKAYEDMYEAIEQGIEDRPPLSGVYQHKACLAIFNQDNKWYRAIILENSDSKVKVKYVDYGNIDVVMLNQVKEIHEDWLKLPPGTITAANYDGQYSSKLTGAELTQALIDTYLDKGPFNAKVIKYEKNIPLVRLTDESGELVCRKLMDSEPIKDCDETSS